MIPQDNPDYKKKMQVRPKCTSQEKNARCDNMSQVRQS